MAAPRPAAAQYFGQNKVQYGKFDFKVVQTEHFDVHYYDRLRIGALDVARMAERSYARLSRILDHRFRERKTIILYASPSDFQQTNTTPGEVGEGTGGFTDFFKQRNIFPLTGSYHEIEHVLTHEMVHQFQMDVLSSGRTIGSVQQIATTAPPLWFMEGMAEYLSVGPVTPETAMWLRDAVVEDRLPSILQMTYDPRIFPYRFGHALWAYIADRWGDEAIGAILQGVPLVGWEQAVRRSLGVSLDALSDNWRDHVKARYYPELGDQVRARRVGEPMLTRDRTTGTLHLAPALSPDGKQVAFFSEADFLFVDFYLADVATGRITRRLLKSTWSADYETYRFLNSQASWSPDGRYLAFAAKRGPRDDLVILDVARNRIVRRLRVKVDGITTPSWSPDGKRLAFTGYDGGLSDLFVINADGTGLARLTNDRHAALHPVWHPDGRTLAFTTDRGPGTDFDRLTVGNFRIATIDVATREVRVLPDMDHGRNMGPVWAPDGRSLAFVSDRSGTSNVFLFDFADERTYQLTNVLTGIAGFTPLSPVLSWAPEADRLAFQYYERGRYDVYRIDDPRSLKREPWSPPTPAVAARAEAGPAPEPVVDTVPPPLRLDGSLYRTAEGFRMSDWIAVRPGAADTATGPAALTLAALRDSAALALPDTAEFTFRPYRVRFTPDYIARPTVGFFRDNFGQGFFGGSTILLSDMLGNHNLTFSGFINGRLDESQILAAYTNLSRRWAWAAGLSQNPVFFFQQNTVEPGRAPPEVVLVQNLRRLVFRSAFLRTAYPLTRFQRIEAGATLTNVDDATLQFRIPFVPGCCQTGPQQAVRVPNVSINYVQPSVAFVHDNTLFGFVGPYLGRRLRVEYAQTLGDWSFRQYTVDARRYDKLAGPVTLATRALVLAREGQDAELFPTFIGFPELLRGYTAGSFFRTECVTEQSTTPGGSGCPSVDQLVGSSFAVANVELRLPLASPTSRLLPGNLPPMEAALFYDAAVAWVPGSRVVLSREEGDDKFLVRAPLQSVGASLRINVLGFAVLRFDWAFPLNRPQFGNILLFSIGPTF